MIPAGTQPVAALKRVAQAMLARLYSGTGFVGLRLRQLSRGGFPILMYHRVISEKAGEPGIQPGMYVTPETFEKHVVFLKQHFSIVTMRELFSFYTGEAACSRIGAYCALTFDDGWHDFYLNAFPVLKKNNVPATVFLPTGFIGENEMFWSDRLILLYQNKKSRSKRVAPSPDRLVDRIENLKGTRDANIEQAISILKNYRLDEIEKAISILSDRWELDYSIRKRVFLNWHEIREMLHSGLVSFGSHTHRHQILTTLNSEEIADELVSSRDRLLLMDVAEQQFMPFCYPNGNCNKAVARMVREHGFVLAVTTERGWNSKASDPYRLKRVPVHQDMAYSDHMFGCRLTGLL